LPRERLADFFFGAGFLDFFAAADFFTTTFFLGAGFFFVADFLVFYFLYIRSLPLLIFTGGMRGRIPSTFQRHNTARAGLTGGEF
jgi:hypothetical protein